LDHLVMSDGLCVVFDSEERLPPFEAPVRTKDAAAAAIARMQLNNVMYNCDLTDTFAQLRRRAQPADILDLPLCPDLDPIRESRRHLEETKHTIFEDDAYDFKPRPAPVPEPVHEEEFDFDAMEDGEPDGSAIEAAFASAVAETLKADRNEPAPSSSAPAWYDDPMGDDDDGDYDAGPLPAIAAGMDVVASSSRMARRRPVQSVAVDSSFSALMGQSTVSLDSLLLRADAWSGSLASYRRPPVAKPIPPPAASGAAAASKRRRATDVAPVDFASLLDAEDLGSKPKTRVTSINQSAAVLAAQKAGRGKDLLLPDDEHYGVGELCATFTRNQLLLPLVHPVFAAMRAVLAPHNANASGQLRLEAMGMGPSLEDDDELAYEQPRLQGDDDAWGGDNDDGDDGNFDEFESLRAPDALSLNSSFQLVDDVAKPEQIQVNYAKLARQVNIRHLKGEILSHITATPQQVLIDDLDAAGRKRAPIELPQNPREAALSEGKCAAEERRDAASGLDKRQQVLGGNSGRNYVSDFQTLVGSMGAYKTKDSNPLPTCFVGLLLLANERNLELRSCVPPEGEGLPQGKAVPEADVGFDLTNFHIFTPVSDEEKSAK
jgi:hypothetical protein